MFYNRAQKRRVAGHEEQNILNKKRLHGQNDKMDVDSTAPRDVYKGIDVSIRPIATSKDKIKQPKLATKEFDMLIPPLGSSVIMSGKSGSGKSTLLARLLLEKQFYKGFFDKIFLFSPTANGDDIQRELNIPKKHVFTDLDEAPELLEVILKSQKKKLENTPAHKTQQYAIIFDDVIGNTKFMNSNEFTQCFYQVRHVCCTTFICTQHFKRVPRVCRLQANFIFYFRGSQSELETLVEDFAPPNMTTNDFRQLVFNATSGQGYDFLTINMKVPWGTRFRKNLGRIIQIEDETADSNLNLFADKNQKAQNGPKSVEPHQGGTEPKEWREQETGSAGGRALAGSRQPTG